MVGVGSERTFFLFFYFCFYFYFSARLGTPERVLESRPQLHSWGPYPLDHN